MDKEMYLRGADGHEIETLQDFAIELCNTLRVVCLAHDGIESLSGADLVEKLYTLLDAAHHGAFELDEQMTNRFILAVEGTIASQARIIEARSSRAETA